MKANIAFESCILVVDDDADFLEMVAGEIQEHYFKVVTALNGFEALQVLSRNHVDCIVTDFKMPEMDGLTLIRELAQKYPEIPAILLTGNGADPQIVKALEEGLFDYLDKPFKTAVLVNRINNALILPRLESLLLEIVQAEFPDFYAKLKSSKGKMQRLDQLSALEALLRTRLLKRRSA